MTVQPLGEFISLEHALQTERPRLVRLCARICGDPQAADDLAQETLFEAWRNAHKLVEPSGYAKWLSAIARNVCYRWARRHGRELAHEISLEPVNEPSLPIVETYHTPQLDLEHLLEQEDLANLIDRALTNLPLKTRQIITRRYLQQLPQAEVAAQLGMTENAVAVRLHRGKEALRKVLHTKLRQEISLYGVELPEPDTWQETRIWCPICGGRHLMGRFSGAEFSLRCPDCAVEPDDYLNHRNLPDGLIDSLKSYKPALTRALAWSHHYFHPGLESGTLPCYNCGQPAPLHHHLPHYAPPSKQTQRGFHLCCNKCRAKNYGTLQQWALTLPEVQQFWRNHPRIRTQPEQEITIDGRPGIRITIESLSSSAQLDLLFDQATFAQYHPC